MIPKIIMQTSKTKNDKIKNLLMRQFPGWEYHHYNDKQSAIYMNENPILGIQDPVKKCFKYKNGAHRADFFRYYFLYINGGGFIDSDLMIYKNIEDLLMDKQFISVNSSHCPGHIFQGFLFVEKENEIIFRALKKMYVATTEEIDYINTDRRDGYLTVTKDLYNIVQEYLPNDNIKLFSEGPIIDYISPDSKKNTFCNKIGQLDNWFGIHWQNEKIVYNWNIEDKNFYNFSKDKENKLREIFKVNKTSGHEYIRIGMEHDGGYVIANDISRDDYVISCGIADNIGWSTEYIKFENELSSRAAGIDMYDFAIDSLPHMPPNGRFFKAEIGKDTTIKDLLNNSGIQNDYILKMDIEGAEWDFFTSVESADIEKFRQIVIELHWLSNLQKIDSDYNKIISVLSKINETHNLVLIHGNNYSTLFNYGDLVIPNVIEALYLRKDSYNFVNENEKVFDHPEFLNVACADDVPEVVYLI